MSTFSFILIYDPLDKRFDFNSLENHLKNIENETKAKINYFFVDINKIEENIKKIKEQKLDINLITCLPSEAKYIQLFLNEFPSLKWVHSMFAGVDAFLKIKDIIDDSKGITLTNSRGAYSDPLAEYSIMTMLYFSYNIPSYYQLNVNKKWGRTGKPNHMLEGRKLVIYGYGKNGIALAKRAKSAFNMHITGIVRKMRDNIEGKEYCDEIYDFSQINGLLNSPKNPVSDCDFLLNTLPYTKASINYFNKEFFSKMNANAVFINIGRGSAVVEEDLVDFLKNNKIKGAALDVTQTEPLNSDSILYSVDKTKLLITNHSGDITDDYIEQSYKILLMNIRNYITQNGKYTTVVNKEEGY